MYIWMLGILVKASCLENKYIINIILLFFASCIVFILLWFYNEASIIVIILLIYPIYFFYKIYLRYWYSKWMSIFMSLPIICLLLFPIVVLWKGKYKYIPCDKQDKDISPSENRQEETTKEEV